MVGDWATEASLLIKAWRSVFSSRVHQERKENGKRGKRTLNKAEGEMKKINIKGKKDEKMSTHNAYKHEGTGQKEREKRSGERKKERERCTHKSTYRQPSAG